MRAEELQILFHDEYYVAINKPYGFLTHKSAIDPHCTQIVLQTLRDQLDRKVYPVHRLDRKTSGVLILGLDPKSHSELSKAFQENKVKKTYYAVVRGYTENENIIDHDLVHENGKIQSAVTHYSCIQKTELPWPLGKHETSRYSLVKLEPQTGRMHQLRRHMNHIRHPILGDRPHGCSKQNRFFKHVHDYSEMMLHARALEFQHPTTLENIKITAPFSDSFVDLAKKLNIDLKSV